MAEALTPEQVAEMERQLAEYRAQQDEQSKEVNRQALQPLVDLGFGTDLISGSPEDIVAALRNSAPALQAMDSTLFNLLTSTSQVLQTTNDRIRTLWQQNKSADADPEQPEEPSE